MIRSAARRLSHLVTPDDFSAATLPADVVHRERAALAGSRAACQAVRATTQCPAGPRSVGPIAAPVDRLAVRALPAMSGECHPLTEVYYLVQLPGFGVAL
jgi:hypothetical protein